MGGVATRSQISGSPAQLLNGSELNKQTKQNRDRNKIEIDRFIKRVRFREIPQEALFNFVGSYKKYQAEPQVVTSQELSEPVNSTKIMIYRNFNKNTFDNNFLILTEGFIKFGLNRQKDFYDNTVKNIENFFDDTLKELIKSKIDNSKPFLIVDYRGTITVNTSCKFAKLKENFSSTEEILDSLENLKNQYNIIIIDICGNKNEKKFSIEDNKLFPNGKNFSSENMIDTKYGYVLGYPLGTSIGFTEKFHAALFKVCLFEVLLGQDNKNSKVYFFDDDPLVESMFHLYFKTEKFLQQSDLDTIDMKVLDYSQQYIFFLVGNKKGSLIGLSLNSYLTRIIELNKINSSKTNVTYDSPAIAREELESQREKIMEYLKAQRNFIPPEGEDETDNKLIIAQLMILLFSPDLDESLRLRYQREVSNFIFQENYSSSAVYTSIDYDYDEGKLKDGDQALYDNADAAVLETIGLELKDSTGKSVNTENIAYGILPESMLMAGFNSLKVGTNDFFGIKNSDIKELLGKAKDLDSYLGRVGFSNPTYSSTPPNPPSRSTGFENPLYVISSVGSNLGNLVKEASNLQEILQTPNIKSRTIIDREISPVNTSQMQNLFKRLITERDINEVNKLLNN